MHSAKVISLDDARGTRDERAETLWQAYVVAKARADASGKYEDGVAAVRLWKRFLALFGAMP